MGLCFSTHNRKHGRPDKIIVTAELRKTYPLNYRSIGGNYLEWGAFEDSSGSSLFRTILHIVGLGSKKKMIRSNALPIVALVTNHKAISDSAFGKFVRHSMRPKPARSSVWAMTKNAVSLAINDANPFPTFFRFIDFFPKTLSNRLVARHMFSPLVGSSHR